MIGEDTRGPLRVLAVDDEQPALADLVYLLRANPEIGDILTARDAAGALRLLHDHDVDIAFLDVRMAGLDGMDLARVLARFAIPPAIVFVSAYDEHAVEAFEVRATDYLRKPVRAERLSEAVRRARRARRGGPAATPRDDGEDLRVVPVDTGGRIRLVERQHVTHVEAAGDYVRLHTSDGAFLVRMPISTLEARWDQAGFARVHRKWLVALAAITELRADAGGGWTVRVGDRDLPVSRRHTRALRDRLVRGARQQAGEP